MQHVEYYNYQPGDGTRYQVIFVHIQDVVMAKKLGLNEHLGGWLVSQVNIPRCAIFQARNFLHHSYVMEKFNMQSEPSGIALTQLIGHVTEREVEDPWPKCSKCGLPMSPGHAEDHTECISCLYPEFQAH